MIKMRNPYPINTLLHEAFEDEKLFREQQYKRDLLKKKFDDLPRIISDIKRFNRINDSDLDFVCVILQEYHAHTAALVNMEDGHE